MTNNHPKCYSEDNIKSQIFTGNAVFNLLEEIDFIEKWKNLVKLSSFGSIFQEPSFVIPWYKTYEKEFIPIVLTLFDEDALVGLLTLAQSIDIQTGKKSKKIQGAGTTHALYQTWLVLPEYQISFWKIGIRNLIDLYPKGFINLKSVPDLRIIESLQALRDFQKMTVLNRLENPVLDYCKEDFKSILSKRHFKSKVNRLNRAGRVRFEKVLSKDDLEHAFDDLEVYYDLRQGAAFNKMPFEKDPKQREMFMEWFSKGILHVTLLWLDEALIAGIIIVQDNNKTAHLAGLITYSPIHGKFSPGLVHLYYLANLLAEEGYQYLKLSPGYDSYKERFCNSHEQVYELLISKTFRDVFKRKLRNQMHQGFLKMGKRPMEIDVDINKNKAIIKNRMHYFLMKNLKRNLLSEIETKNWFLNNFIQKSEPEIGYRKNNLRDLLKVKDFDFNISRWEFLNDALNRLEENQSFITIVIEDKLCVCIWYSTSSQDRIELNDKIKIYISLKYQEKIYKN